jgi:uncharacterized protein YcfL
MDTSVDTIKLFESEKKHAVQCLKNKINRQIDIHYKTYERYKTDLTNEQLCIILENIYNEVKDLCK